MEINSGETTVSYLLMKINYKRHVVSFSNYTVKQRMSRMGYIDYMFAYYYTSTADVLLSHCRQLSNNESISDLITIYTNLQNCNDKLAYYATP